MSTMNRVGYGNIWISVSELYQLDNENQNLKYSREYSIILNDQMTKMTRIKIFFLNLFIIKTYKEVEVNKVIYYWYIFEKNN